MSSINKHSHYNFGYYLIILNFDSETGNLAIFNNSRFYSETCHAILLNRALHYDFDLTFAGSCPIKKTVNSNRGNAFSCPLMTSSYTHGSVAD